MAAAGTIDEPLLRQCNTKPTSASLWSFHIVNRLLRPFSTLSVFEKLFTSRCRLLATNHDDCKDDPGQVAEQSQCTMAAAGTIDEPLLRQCNTKPTSASLWSFHIVNRLLRPFSTLSVFEKLFTSRCRLLATNHDDCKDDPGQVAEQSQDGAHNDLPSTAQIPVYTKRRDEVRANARNAVVSAHCPNALTAVLPKIG
eukprot:CAMPEP_0172777456 /NCGR_PEP_ID=MMETSP1074-20121228/201410_1 /TAXON_ID=2916 /ORGANISM="Ceratium fusus, Strain PA161109" /LENGTH=196 /DNA_ID=CAMNT_0013614373 /DNA_START=123 /DNA_END=713 /DNA_ORIENTATION=-